MTFRTEMVIKVHSIIHFNYLIKGLYYSYFKTIIEADTLKHGVLELFSNNQTEYPDTINVLRRFNLYPEVIKASEARLIII